MDVERETRSVPRSMKPRLTDIETEARRHGMSYGQWVAARYLDEQPRHVFGVKEERQ